MGEERGTDRAVGEIGELGLGEAEGCCYSEKVCKLHCEEFHCWIYVLNSKNGVIDCMEKPGEIRVYL